MGPTPVIGGNKPNIQDLERPINNVALMAPKKDEKTGLSLPLDDWCVAVLDHLRVAPSQLHPNAWGFIRSFTIFYKSKGFPFTIKLFFCMFHVTHNTNLNKEKETDMSSRQDICQILAKTFDGASMGPHLANTLGGLLRPHRLGRRVELPPLVIGSLTFLLILHFSKIQISWAKGASTEVAILAPPLADRPVPGMGKTSGSESNSLLFFAFSVPRLVDQNLVTSRVKEIMGGITLPEMLRQLHVSSMLAASMAKYLEGDKVLVSRAEDRALAALQEQLAIDL
ncbi:hypothetical protein Lal_00012639 [Lupinus albus]|nr:hypothetical protein Lal_00012639 [Lupinus albus]